MLTKMVTTNMIYWIMTYLEISYNADSKGSQKPNNKREFVETQ